MDAFKALACTNVSLCGGKSAASVKCDEGSAGCLVGRAANGNSKCGAATVVVCASGVVQDETRV